MKKVEKLNIEIKAHCADPETVRGRLDSLNARYHGLDHQVDTYFNCDQGRLKLRQGPIENSLIFYQRENQKGPKKSEIAMSQLSGDEGIGEVLSRAYGVMTVVDKKRHIYFIDNVKFHVDVVEELGSFMEIEAIDETGEIGREALLKQCEDFMRELGVRAEDLIDKSYSDLIMEKGK